MTHWHVTDVGCVAIWPVTVPNRHRHKGVSMQGPPKGTFSKSGQKGPRGRGRGRQVRFGGLNVLYDEDGNVFPVDDAGQLYVPLEYGQAAGDNVEIEVEKNKDTKN